MNENKKKEAHGIDARSQPLRPSMLYVLEN